MIGWRARLGFLLPPGNPTVEPEMIALAPEGVSVHFHRMAAYGAPGSLEGQDERTRTMIDNIDGSIELLASVAPDVIVVAHTATSYYLGREGEADLLARVEKSTGKRVITAFGSVLRALERLDVRRLALGAPYSRETTLQGRRIWKRTAWRSSISPICRGSPISTRRPPSGPMGWRGWSTVRTPKPSSSAAPAWR